MPGMTTMPIFQSAPLASGNTKSVDAMISSGNAPDAQNPSAPLSGTDSANIANSLSTEPSSDAETGNAEDSFAEVLQRQMAQTSPVNTPVADFNPIAAQVLEAQPVSVETLLSDLSNFSGQLVVRGVDPALVPPGSGTVADSLSAAAVVSETVFHVLPVGMPAATDTPGTESISQIIGPATDDVAPEEMPLDGLAAIAQLVQAVQPGNHSQSAAGETAGEDKLATADTSRWIPTSALPTSASPTTALPAVAIAGTDADPRAVPAPPAEFLLNTAGKSAEFAATQTPLTEVVSPHATNGQSVESEKSFDAFLSAAQAGIQHRNGEVHVANGHGTPVPVQTPVGSHGWDGEVGDKLVWMVGRQEQRAELVLNPPQMGRIEVSLSLNDGQTSALFVSANPAVRDALEAALPRLREILADAGINLGQAQVGADTGNNAGESSTNGAENRDNSARGLSKDELSPGSEILRQLDAPQWLQRGNGLVDIFA